MSYFILVPLALWLACALAVVCVFTHSERGPYPPEAAEAPDIVARGYSSTGDTFGFERSTPWVDGNHPQDCANDCCFGARLDELVAAYDWEAAEKDLARKGRTK